MGKKKNIADLNYCEYRLIFLFSYTKFNEDVHPILSLKFQKCIRGDKIISKITYALFY